MWTDNADFDAAAEPAPIANNQLYFAPGDDAGSYSMAADNKGTYK